MPAKAGQIVIDITAGTSKFVVDMEAAKAKIREFGTAGVSEHKAVSAAMKLVEGNFTNNKRAADAFLLTLPGLGKAVAAAFPVIGALAFAGIIGEVGHKVYEFFKNIEEAPKKIASAFRDLNAPLQLTNAQLDVANARLENEIAKLEGRHENTLKVALLEAKEAAEKLADSLEKDLEKMNKILDKENVGALRRMFGEAGTGDLAAMSAQLEHSVGAVSGNESISDAEKRVRIIRLYQAALEDLNAKAKQGPGISIAKTIMSGGIAQLQDTGARGEAIGGFQKYLQDELARINKEGTNEGLRGKKGGLEEGASERKAYQSELKRLQEELNRAQEAQLVGIEKINAEEQNEINKLVAAKQFTGETATLIGRIYDAKRVTEYAAEAKKVSEELAKTADEWRKLENESAKKWGIALFKEDIEEGTKKLEAMSREFDKLAKESALIMGDAGAAGMQHRINMAGINGNPGDPLGTLAKQQGIERQAIEDRYNISLKYATSELEKANAIKQRALDLLKLQYEMEERTAQVRQRGVKDFFRDMQGQAQTAGNIFYEAMHNALDRTSDELAKLFTGQKTSFGEMLKGIGQEMTRDAVKSGLQKGLGALGGLLGIHSTAKADGSQANPFHVIVDDSGDGGGKDGSGLLRKGASGLGKLLKGIFSKGSDDSDAEPMASGGDVYPGQAYIVGDGGEPELFHPRTAGTVTPMSKMGGGSVNYHIDARGAALGVENRIARSIEMAHASAVSNSLRANSERSKRTPQRQGRG